MNLLRKNSSINPSITEIVNKIDSDIIQRLNYLDSYQNPSTLTFGTITSWFIPDGYNRKLTLTGNSTLVINGLKGGEYGTLEIIQDATGSRTLTLPSNSIVMGTQGTSTLTLTTTANAIDIATFYYNGTTIYWNISLW